GRDPRRAARQRHQRSPGDRHCEAGLAIYRNSRCFMNAKVIFSGAFILFVGNLLSSFLGMGREVMTAAYYGADVEMDAYLFANTIPSLFLAFIGGVFTAGFIPLFIKKRV